jgi:hypothetical protein
MTRVVSHKQHVKHCDGPEYFFQMGADRYPVCVAALHRPSEKTPGSTAAVSMSKLHHTCGTRHEGDADNCGSPRMDSILMRVSGVWGIMPGEIEGNGYKKPDRFQRSGLF